MSQFGMQMPGGQVSRGRDVDVYTGLLLLAAVALLAATGFLFVQGGKLGVGGNPLEIHPEASVKSGELKLSDMR